MLPIEKNTITIGKAAAVLVFIAGGITTGLTSYYSAKAGVQKGFETAALENAARKSEITLLQWRMDQAAAAQNKLSDQVDVNTLTIKTVVDFIKPEEVKRKNYR